MSNISSWTTSAAGNNATPPDGAPEGCLPGAVNDIIRENMSAVRRWYVDAEWINWGDTLVRQSNNSFLVSRTATDFYTAGRRLKLYDSTTIYGNVISSSPSGANTLVTVSSSNLSSSLSSGAAGILNPQFNSIPPLDSPTITTGISGSSIATQAQQETGSSTSVIVTPGRQQYHPSAAKGWVVFNSSGTVGAGYNVTSVTHNSTGVYTINWTTAFSSANYVVVGIAEVSGNTGARLTVASGGRATTTTQVLIHNASENLTDPQNTYVIAFGDQ